MNTDKISTTVDCRGNSFTLTNLFDLLEILYRDSLTPKALLMSPRIHASFSNLITVSFQQLFGSSRGFTATMITKWTTSYGTIDVKTDASLDNETIVVRTNKRLPKYGGKLVGFTFL